MLSEWAAGIGKGVGHGKKKETGWAKPFLGLDWALSWVVLSLGSFFYFFFYS